MIKQDYSFGIIPLRKERGEWEVLLVQLHQGHWGYPKGHPEPNETPFEAAKRELKEETGLVIESLLDAPPFHEKYAFHHQGQRIEKTVTYFLAVVSGDIVIQTHEIAAYKWVSLDQTKDYISFDAGIKLTLDIKRFLAAIKDT